MKPTYIDTAALADRLCISRRNVHYWLATGYLPQPVFKSRQCTLWDERDIASWAAAGHPWSDPERAKRIAEEVGTEQLNAMVQPDADTDRDVSYEETLAIREVDKEFAAED